MRGVLAPGSLEELGEVFGTHRVSLMSGGTVVLPRWHEDAADTVLVRLSAIPRLLGPIDDGCGALTTVAELAEGLGVPDCLVRSAASIGGPALRETATVGGNIGSGSPACLAVALLAVRAEVVHWTPGRGFTRAPLAGLDLAPSAAVRPVPRVIVSLSWTTPVSSVFVKVRAHGSFGPPALSLALARYGGGEMVLAAGGPGVLPRVLSQLSEQVRYEGGAVPVERLRWCAHRDGGSQLLGLDRDLLVGMLWRALEDGRHGS